MEKLSLFFQKRRISNKASLTVVRWKSVYNEEKAGGKLRVESRRRCRQRENEFQKIYKFSIQ